MLGTAGASQVQKNCLLRRINIDLVSKLLAIASSVSPANAWAIAPILSPTTDSTAAVGLAAGAAFEIMPSQRRNPVIGLDKVLKPRPIGLHKVLRTRPIIGNAAFRNSTSNATNTMTITRIMP